MVRILKIYKFLLDVVGGPKGIPDSVSMHFLETIWRNYEFLKYLKWVYQNQVYRRLSWIEAVYFIGFRGWFC